MIEFLTMVPLFKMLNNDHLKAVANICHMKTIAPGTVLFREKEPGNTFYIVYSGAVKVYTTGANGDEKILSVFKEGDSFGELSLLDGKPRSASAQTLETSVLITLVGRDFLALLKDQFDITLGIMQELCNRLRDTNQQVHDLTFLDANSRVLKSLIKLANKHGKREGNVIIVKMVLNYDEISQMAGVQKPVLMQVMRHLQERGILNMAFGDMRLDVSKLRS
ncbi:Crp/Fnr family transcriptional regulator [Paenibacillus chartarius]|uniref:Crp/Fnr family transcriptional regulator n=1 Tax=Paenibacillus chartarius TaxID=747481 RepID=A0ABV6DIZ7_9BACL